MEPLIGFACWQLTDDFSNFVQVFLEMETKKKKKNMDLQIGSLQQKLCVIDITAQSQTIDYS